MEVRGAIIRTSTARVTAKGDRFTILVAAVRKAAIALFELDQREMARIDLDTAKLDHLVPLEHWRRVPEEFARPEVVGGTLLPGPHQLGLVREGWRA